MASCFVYFSTNKMDTVRSSETSVKYRTARYFNPKDCIVSDCEFGESKLTVIFKAMSEFDVRPPKMFEHLMDCDTVEIFV
jgi:hypothetical protein